VERGGSVDVCDMDISILNVYLFVLVCGGMWFNTLYPARIALSTGAF